ncbi:MAG: ABC transporter permease, partial [Spirochaetales bacterium]|nr:ABC transporter permease [Spirochaetales bacterium]
FKVIPLPVIYLVIIAVLAHFILKRTAIGRYVFATGSNEEAARLSGINVRIVKLVVYSISGLMSGLSGAILVARLNSAQPAIGSGYELDAIAAAVIGGTSLSGGEGQIIGTIIGALIMSTMKNGLNLMHVSQFWQQVIIGVVVIVAVYIDIKRRDTQRP